MVSLPAVFKQFMMMDDSAKSKNKRIAKNTVLLYIRSVVVMLLSLYTSRVILIALGVEDYGLYNVVGGVVALFSFLRTSMTKSTQRFLNVEMTKDNGRLADTFRSSLTLHIIIAAIALVLAESIGLWFLNTYIIVPEGRLYAANLVYQSTILSLLATIISVPYSAAIIAHEEMGYFAVVSIIDAVLKLFIAWLIMLDGFDRLVMYGYLLMAISILNIFLYILYCKKHFRECINRLLFDRGLIKDMLGYTTWTVVGQAAIVGTNQGNNILVNIFHSVTANASMGVASQVNSAVVSLTANFQTAFNPQITKSYALKDFIYLKQLVYSTSKISFFLLICVSLPIMFNIDTLLGLWLKEVPKDCGAFCVLLLWNSILNALSAPLNFTVLSSHKIKWFQITTSLVYLLDLLILYIFFVLGAPAITAMWVKIFIMVLILFVRLFYCSREIECISILSYIFEVLLPLSLASTLSGVVSYILLPKGNTICNVIFSALFVFVISCAFSYFVGLNKREKSLVAKMLKKIITK